MPGPNVLPLRIYLDTSAIVATLVIGSPRHLQSLDALRRHAEQDAIVCVSQLVRAELLQSAIALATLPFGVSGRVRRQFRLHRWGDFPDVRDQWLRHVVTLQGSLFAQFSRVEEIGITPEIGDDAISIMAQFQLKSYDAIHVATAISLDATEFLTSDRDFERVMVSGLTIRTIS